MKTLEKSGINIIKMFGKEYKFSMFNPGGNYTGFIEGIIENKIQRQIINQKMLSLYPDMEQLGFIDLSKNDRKLEMAGGEFCGNAARSFIYKFLNGKKGIGKFAVSGAKKKLKGGITENGDVWSYMPTSKNLSIVQEDKECKGNYIVKMEGIVHYISFEKKYGLCTKEKSLETIQRLGLDLYSAAGVIYVIQKNNNIYIEPFVYVRKADIIYHETGCGSGTAALGLVLAYKNKTSIHELDIIQPSGKGIKVSVKLNKLTTKIDYVKIQGKVEQLM